MLAGFAELVPKSANELLSLVSYSLHMLKRPTILLLAAVITLGAAFAVPSVSADRGAEVCAIVRLAAQQCERQEIGLSGRGNADVASAPVCFHYKEAPLVRAVKWPVRYQRPPTCSSLS